jgi:hypothetical protein
MKGSTKVEVIRDGRVCLETTATSEVPKVVLADTSDIGDFPSCERSRTTLASTAVLLWGSAANIFCLMPSVAQ